VGNKVVLEQGGKEEGAMGKLLKEIGMEENITSPIWRCKNWSSESAEAVEQPRQSK
jgi:hypothetical protein